MFAVLAAVCFAVTFVLRLLGEALGRADLIALGLFLLALHLVVPVPVRRA